MPILNSAAALLVYSFYVAVASEYFLAYGDKGIGEFTIVSGAAITTLAWFALNFLCKRSRRQEFSQFVRLTSYHATFASVWVSLILILFGSFGKISPLTIVIGATSVSSTFLFLALHLRTWLKSNFFLVSKKWYWDRQRQYRYFRMKRGYLWGAWYEGQKREVYALEVAKAVILLRSGKAAEARKCLEATIRNRMVVDENLLQALYSRAVDELDETVLKVDEVNVRTLPFFH